MKTPAANDWLDAEHTLFLCATARLSQDLRLQHARAMAQAGSTQWRTLDSQTVAQWLLRLRDDLMLRGASVSPPLSCVLLDPLQERLLWESVIRDDLGESAHLLFDLASLSKSAMQAHALSVVWRIPTDTTPASQETRRFAAWQRRFMERCRQQQWVDASRMAQAVVHELPRQASQLRWPQRVVFAGFSRYNPLELQLQAFFDAQGIAWVESRPDGPAATPSLRSYPDTAAECLAAALWVRSQLATNAGAHLAIVVPDLAATRHVLQDTLEDVLDPSLIRASRSESPRVFNVSLGQPLASYPLVGAALSMLALMTQAHQVSQAALGSLLRAPFWSAAVTEAADRARLEAELRPMLAPRVPLARYVQAARRQAEQLGLQVPRLLRHLEAMLEAGTALARRQLPSVWAAALADVLRQTGWLHERQLSSHEFQTREAFLESLAQLSRLDAFMGPVHGADVLGQLRRQCQERVFQPKTEGQPSVQVLGLLETSGLRFDGVWVMGMVDTDWPPPARPNPLLSYPAQRQAASPNASAAVQLEFALALHQGLLHAAPEVIFSWPRMAGAAELKPSPIIGASVDVPALPAAPSPHWSVAAAATGGAGLLPPCEDAFAPPVAAGERVRGGTWLLRAQAICPAWAYYRYRLGAGRLEEPVDGLDARQRGTLLHTALQHFWQAIDNSQALQALPLAQRERAVADAVDQALLEHDQDPACQALQPRFRALERLRLIRLVLGWLALEVQREHAFAVVANERAASLDIEGIRVHMKLDRIDQLDDGRLLVIDYKTGGSIDTKNWASQRLTEPQLPIYAAIVKPDEGPVAGVVFAKVRLKEPAWAGLAAQDKLLPKVPGLDSKAARALYPVQTFPDWASVLQHWEQRIRAMAVEIVQGDAGVRFSDAQQLRYCDVVPLLRLSERQDQLQAAQRRTQERPS